MRDGVRLGIDVGKVRIGVARSDAHGLLATPVETIARTAAGGTSSQNTAGQAEWAEADIDRIVHLAEELSAVEIVVGLPVSLLGEHTASTTDALQFARRIVCRLSGLNVRMVDERLSTVSAYQALRTSGKKSRGSRQMIDQVAAVIILQHALDTERASGMPPGSTIPPSEGL